MRDRTPQPRIPSLLRWIPALTFLLTLSATRPDVGSAQIEGPAEAIRSFNGNCGDTIVIYTHPATASAQDVAIRISNTGDCDFRAQFGPANGPFQGQPNGSFLDEFDATHDTFFRFNPGDVARIICDPGRGACSGQWMTATVATWGRTAFRCGGDNDIGGNLLAVDHEITYVVCNKGDCPMFATCNGDTVFVPGVGVATIAVGKCLALTCTLEAANPRGGSVFAFRCPGPGTTCVARFRQVGPKEAK